MIQSTLCYIERAGQYLMLHRVKKENDLNHDKWVGVGGKFLDKESPEECLLREVKEETGVDVVVTDLVSVKSSRKVLTYANGDNTMYMDHLFICRPDPNGNTEPFVGDEESLNVGWFSPDALPEPLAATTVERMAYVREYLKAKANGDSHAQFAFNGTIR